MILILILMPQPLAPKGTYPHLSSPSYATDVNSCTLRHIKINTKETPQETYTVVNAMDEVKQLLRTVLLRV